jgi:hypothetical protein
MSNLKVRLPASGSAIAILLIAMATLFEQPLARAVEPLLPGEWPPIKPGIRSIETTRVLPNGKTKHAGGTGPICGGDTSALFIGYWGGGIVEMAGCRHIPTKLADDKFKIVNECIVRGLAKPSRGEMEVTMHPNGFEEHGTVREGNQVYRVTRIGRRLSECPAAPAERRHGQP